MSAVGLRRARSFAWSCVHAPMREVAKRVESAVVMKPARSNDESNTQISTLVFVLRLSNASTSLGELPLSSRSIAATPREPVVIAPRPPARPMMYLSGAI